MPHDFQADLDIIARIDAIPTILDVVCRTTGMRFAAVARVTQDRWIACSVRDEIAFGLLPGGELKVETTICDEIRDSREPVVIDDVSKSAIYSTHHTPAMYGLQSYISMPIITRDGDFFGTLCAIDPSPAKLENPETIGMFKLFADLIAFHLDAQRQLADSQAMLLTERQGAELREQFIAVLGHDLRNPLAAIDAGTRLLLRAQPEERARSIIAQMQASVVRMSGLITNVLDFARGRLGGGLTLERKKTRLLALLGTVVDELQATTDRKIETDFANLEDIHCDADRIGQMLSNLLGNALTHGAENSPAWVSAKTDPDAFVLTVTNLGDPIPQNTMTHLFQPFFRASARPNQEGLGLGLYIASQIAKAHGGTLTAESIAGKTHFTFRMPLA